MPELVIPQAVLVRLVWKRGLDDAAINVLGAINIGAIAINQSLANTVGAAIKGAFSSSGFAAIVGQDVALSEVGLRNINVANQAEFPHTAGPVSGTNVGELLPPQICLVITHRTALAGPSYRGRTFLWGFTEASNTGGSVCLDSAADAALAFLVAVQGVLAANGLTLAVLSRPRDAQVAPLPIKPAKAGWATPVTSLIIRNLGWDTQRKRAVSGI